jgi:hypothetical protein
LAINEDFDFAIAMSSIGPGIAAAARKSHNATKARLLASLAVTSATRRRLDEVRACGVHVYGLLWGTASAMQLRIVTDRFDASGHLTASTTVPGSTRPAEGPGGWASTPEPLDGSIREVLGLLSDCDRCR